MKWKDFECDTHKWTGSRDEFNTFIQESKMTGNKNVDIGHSSMVFTVEKGFDISVFGEDFKKNTIKLED